MNTSREELLFEENAFLAVLSEIVRGPVGSRDERLNAKAMPCLPSVRKHARSGRLPSRMAGNGLRSESARRAGSRSGTWLHDKKSRDWWRAMAQCGSRSLPGSRYWHSRP